MSASRSQNWAKNRATHPARRQVYLAWGVAILFMLALTTFLMRNWLRGGLPTSERREVLTELVITWLFKQELLRGRVLSEWNPYWFCGFPWLRFLSYPVYYPLAALSAWGRVPLETVQVLFYFLVITGSGLTMFGFLRQALGDWRAALVGALIYETFPYHNHVGVETWIHAAFWAFLPLPLWFTELSQTEGRKRIRYLLLTGVALGLFPIVSSEYALLAGPFVVLYFLAREFAAAYRCERSFRHFLGSAILVGGIALGIAAFYVLPGLFEVRYVGIHGKHGAGTTFTNTLLREFSITPRLVWYAIARRFRLLVNKEGLPEIASSFWSISWYPGIIVPLVAALGLGAVRSKFVARAALVGLGLALLLISGPTFTLNVFTYLPSIGRLSPFRGMMLVVACLATLAALGVQALLRRWPIRWATWGVMVGVVVLVLFDFWPSSAAYQTTEAYYTPDERRAYAWLAERNGQGRLWEVGVLPRDEYLRSYSLSEAPLQRFAGYYDNGAPLYTWQQVAWTDIPTKLRVQWVRYVLLRAGEQETDEIRETIRGAGYRQALVAGPVEVWENQDIGNYAKLYSRAMLDVTQDFRHPFRALPELVVRNIAMVTPATFHLDDLAPILDRYDYFLTDEPEALQTLVDRLKDRMVASSGVSTLDRAPRIEAQIAVERPNSQTIRLRVQAPQSGVLSVAESWYPNWRVRVDGKPREVLRVNWALLGVWLEAGEQCVEFYYQRPYYVYVGYAITLLTILALFVWWFGAQRSAAR